MFVFVCTTPLCSLFSTVTEAESSADVRMLHLHPSSSLSFVRPPEFVVYQELVFSTKVFMRHVSAVDSAVLAALQKQYSPVHSLVAIDLTYCLIDYHLAQSAACTLLPHYLI